MLTRGKLAAQTGCNIETIRYYEATGLLPAPGRTAAGYRVSLPWGSDSEHERAERIAKVDPAVFVLPRLNLKTLAALLHRSSGVVAVDTGLGHLSAALGVPAISMYGPTSPARVGTYGLHQQHIVGGTPQKGSDPAALMEAISPQTIWEQLQPLMAAAA